jgi:GntR family transcriptional regulator
MDGLHLDPADRTLLHEQVAAENTVLRALRQLREEGLVEFRRGHGISVTGRAPARSAVVSRVRDLVQFARLLGYQPDELIQMTEGLR